MVTPDLTNMSISNFLYNIAQGGIQHAVQGLSEMVGMELTATKPELSFVPILKVPEFIGGPENEAVGVYLRAEGKMSGQFLLILPFAKAMEMVDLLIFEPVGTTQELDDMARSALAEVGNLVGSFFLNSIAALTGMETKPTPPAVMCDMVAAILNVIVATSAEEVDEVIMIRTKIMYGEREVEADFWYIPNTNAMNVIADYVRGNP